MSRPSGLPALAIAPIALTAFLAVAPGFAAISSAASGAAGPAATAGLLVSYSFEDDLVATGPDTFAVYRAAKGHVGLSSAFHLSGYQSVEIRDAAGDGQFPELQGYFPRREHGNLYAHFAILTTDPRQAFNVALAGPEWFALAKDGIGFWLQGRDGFLYQVSDSMPKRLAPLRPFVWYIVDVTYRVDDGTYDLVIHEEGHGAPLVARERQANATHQPGSAIDKFSFIGDNGDDRSEVVYYVDDVVLSAEGPIEATTFAAPGRRRLFIDSWFDAVKAMSRSRDCLPPSGPADFGLDDTDLRAIGEAVKGDLIAAARASGAGGGMLPEVARRLEPIALWARGCDALRAGRAEEALAGFEDAARRVPGGRLYALSAVLALGRLDRFAEADARLAGLAPAWRYDVRYQVTAAALGLARDDLGRALDWLRLPAEDLIDTDGDDPRRGIEQDEVGEQYFFVLLFKGAYQEAERYATRMSDRLRSLGLPNALWVERTGDAAFLRGDDVLAQRLYQEALANKGGSLLLFEKLSDVAYRLGDRDLERGYREKVFGSLLEDENR